LETSDLSTRIPEYLLHVARDVPPARTTILLVEDDLALRQLYRVALELRGHHVEVAADGVTALQLVENGPLPDLVVLDLALPRMSGFTVAAELAANERTRHIPIIIVTGTTEMFDERRFRVVLHKPATPERLAAAVDHAIRGEPEPF
jgi:CheY-like chemotaxis protein